MEKLVRLGSSIGLLLLVPLSVGVQAALSEPTGSVKGRAPVASGVVISNQSLPGAVGARVGHVLRVGYGFGDADGDVESGSAIQWLRDGAAISGAASNSYTTMSTDANRLLSVQVAPKTDPAITDPASGVAVSSAAVAVTTGAVGYGNFLAPDTVLRTWSQARSYCLSRSARLPTESELKQLFVNATSATVANGTQFNTEMCSRYGWPLGGQCPGGTSYWSSTSSGTGVHYVVDMTYGYPYAGANDSVLAHAACLR